MTRRITFTVSDTTLEGINALAKKHKCTQSELLEGIFDSFGDFHTFDLWPEAVARIEAARVQRVTKRKGLQKALKMLEGLDAVQIEALLNKQAA